MSVSAIHEQLARTYSAEAFVKLFELRDEAIRELYLNYGLKETAAMTGWARPTILAAARRAGHIIERRAVKGK